MGTTISAPTSLLEAIKQAQPGYTLVFGYSLEIHHSSMGYFPGLITKGDIRDIVYTDDLSVLEGIWKLLPPEKSKINKNLFYCNEDRSLCHPITDDLIAGYKKIPPERFIDRPYFELLVSDEAYKFKWASGILGPRMDSDTYLRLIEREIKEMISKA